MIEAGTGSILDARVDALVNPVNCVGAMGKGLALEVRRRWPEAYVECRNACRRGLLAPGDVLVVMQTMPAIVNVATKDHWRSPSKIEWVQFGISSLAHAVRKWKFRSIAIPALGCGLGGLDWAEVRPSLVAAFEDLQDVRVLLFDPLGR